MLNHKFFSGKKFFVHVLCHQIHVQDIQNPTLLIDEMNVTFVKSFYLFLSVSLCLFRFQHFFHIRRSPVNNLIHLTCMQSSPHVIHCHRVRNIFWFCHLLRFTDLIQRSTFILIRNQCKIGCVRCELSARTNMNFVYKRYFQHPEKVEQHSKCNYRMECSLLTVVFRSSKIKVDKVSIEKKG